MSKPDAPDLQPISLSDVAGDVQRIQSQQAGNIAQLYGKYASNLGSAKFEAFKAANPNVAKALAGASDLVGRNISELSRGILPTGLQQAFQQNIRGAQAARGLGISPVGAVQEGRELAGLGQELLQNSIANAINIGRSREGGDVSTSDLGLDSSSFQGLLGQGLQVESANRAFKQAEFNAEMSKAEARNKLIGGVVGGGIGLAGGAGYLGKGIQNMASKTSLADFFNIGGQAGGLATRF